MERGSRWASNQQQTKRRYLVSLIRRVQLAQLVLHSQIDLNSEEAAHVF